MLLFLGGARIQDIVVKLLLGAKMLHTLYMNSLPRSSRAHVGRLSRAWDSSSPALGMALCRRRYPCRGRCGTAAGYGTAKRAALRASHQTDIYRRKLAFDSVSASSPPRYHALLVVTPMLDAKFKTLQVNLLRCSGRMHVGCLGSLWKTSPWGPGMALCTEGYCCLDRCGNAARHGPAR